MLIIFETEFYREGCVIVKKDMKIEKNDVIVLICGSIAAVLCMLPFISCLTYSIDDYHLWSVYDINWETMGYNFYSTGRIVEGAIAQLLYWMNLQPLNRPIGMVVFAVSLAIVGMYISKVLDIERLSYRIIIVLLFTINPFFTEIYYYSTITVYSGFAMIFLWLGMKYSIEYYSSKKRSKIIWAIVFYYMSLGIYQIFYPIAGFLLFIFVIKDLFDKKFNWKKYTTYLGVYLVSFILFYVILKVMFYFSPPTLAYDGIDIVQFIKNLFQADYWQKVGHTIALYMGNNTFNSKIIFVGLNVILAILLVLYVFLERSLQGLLKALLVLLYMLAAPIMCFGLGLARLDNVSGRSLTSFGIYETSLFIISLLLINVMKETTRTKIDRILIICFSVVIFANGSLCGKAINTVLRLNSMEKNMVNRIVYRMEEHEEFTGMETLVVYGTPSLGKVTKEGVGDYGLPASATFSKVFLFNEVSGYKFALPNDEQYEKAQEIIEYMDTWPGDNSVMYYDGMFIVRLYY